MLLKSERLEQHMFVIGVDQSLSNSSMHEYRCLENNKKLYTSAVKCDDKKQYKYILRAAMVSNPEGLTENSPMSYVPYMTVKS